MDLLSIALRLAQANTGHNEKLRRSIDAATLERFDIDPETKPFSDGAKSVVFVNRKDHVVSFTKRLDLGDIKRGYESLPAIYGMEDLEIGGNELTVVVESCANEGAAKSARRTRKNQRRMLPPSSA